MRHFISLLLCSTTLMACSKSQSPIDATKILGDMKGPEISGVNATMSKMAKDAENQGDYRASSQVYQQLYDKNPQDINVALQYAESLRRANQPAKALGIYNSIVNKSANNQDALEGKGLAELSLAELDAASATLTQVMSLNPNRWRTLNAIGILFATRGMNAESIQYLNAALQKNPNHPAILNNKGLVMAMDRDFHGALQSLFNASKNSKVPSQIIQADLNAALVYAIAGDMKSAEKLASKHLEGAQLQNNLGQYALLANDQTLARTHLHMALSESKSFYEKAWNNLADLNETTGHGQVGSEKRMSVTSPTNNQQEMPNQPLPDASGQTQGYIQPAPNKAMYTPSGVYGNAEVANPPLSNNNESTTKNTTGASSGASNGFEALGDFITNW